ncbi:MAG: hypothetical protein MI919_35440, partial [Holophagales bacterium]|nr:hypothetical protein [Holophagales bacterium]
MTSDVHGPSSAGRRSSDPERTGDDPRNEENGHPPGDADNDANLELLWRAGQGLERAAASPEGFAASGEGDAKPGDDGGDEGAGRGGGSRWPDDATLRAYREGGLDAPARNAVEEELLQRPALRDRLATLGGRRPSAPSPDLRRKVLEAYGEAFGAEPRKECSAAGSPGEIGIREIGGRGIGAGIDATSGAEEGVGEPGGGASAGRRGSVLSWRPRKGRDGRPAFGPVSALAAVLALTVIALSQILGPGLFDPDPLPPGLEWQI